MAMSDDEMPMPGAGEEDLDLAGEDEEGEPASLRPAADLPEGVRKEVVAEAGGWKKPKNGDEVTVHYVGTLASDGSEFDSSRGRGEPFTFTLGQGQVIKGWDLGVATMKKGEIANFTLAPEYAYGEAGSPPKIPANATLVFEVELLSWVSKDDLFQDGGVIKAEVKEGSGWKKPKAGDEVKVSVKVTAKDGALVEERPGFEYTLGSDALGPIGRAVDKALTEMKKGEQALLKCSKDYAYGDSHPDGVTIDLTLEELFETRDVSFAKDKSLMKKQVVEGAGYDTPKDAAKVTLSVKAATDGSAPLAGFEAKVLEFTAGNGEVCDALECAVAEMKKGEQAILTCTTPALCVEVRLGLASIAAERVVFHLELQDFEKNKETWDMSDEEKLAHGTARKEVGSTLFRSGRTQLALTRYEGVASMFSYVDSMKDEGNKRAAKDLKKTCDLNKAACHLRLKDYTAAKAACDTVLKEEVENVKALFRRAQALFGLKEFFDCIRDVKKVIQLDADNKEAKKLLRDALAAQKEEDQRSKGLFAKMCQGLGKGLSASAPAAKPEGAGAERSKAEFSEPDAKAAEDKDAAATDGQGQKGADQENGSVQESPVNVA